MFEKIREAEERAWKTSLPMLKGANYCDLLEELPVLGRDDKFAGPDLDIPREIETHFTLAKWHEEGRCPLAAIRLFHN